MMKLASVEFFVVLLFILNLVVIFLLMLFVKRVSQLRKTAAEMVESAGSGREEQDRDDRESATAPAMEIRDMLTPLLKASREAADEFDQLIREKKRLTKELNKALDTKIISINLLLSRAGAMKKELEDQQHRLHQSMAAPAQPPPLQAAQNVLDQQNQIIDLYYNHVDIDTIAEQLSIPKGEVQLVIDLKEKFLAMENAQ